MLSRCLLLSGIVLCLFVRPLGADEIDDFVKKVDAKRYTPAEHGLKDLKVQMNNSMMAMNPATAKIKFLLYWKAPDKKHAEIEGLEGPMAGMMPQLEKQGEGMLKLIVPESYVEQKKQFDYQISKEGDQTKLVGTPKEGSDAAKGAKKVTLWFDARNLPVKIETETLSGQGSGTMEVTYIEKDGKFLAESMKGEMEAGPMGKQQMEVGFEYVQIEGVWLPSKISQKIGGMDAGISFDGYEVNKGLDDSIFSGGARKDDGGGK